MKEKKRIEEYIIDGKLDIEKVMNDFTPYIYIIVKNKEINLADEDVEEIISDVFLALWKNQNRLDVNKQMSSYLAGIAKNMINKKTRNIQNNDDLTNYENVLYENENTEMKIQKNMTSDLIMREIGKMKEEDKTIFMSYYYHAKTMEEISNMLKISEGKVKSRLFRIRKKLKKVLEKRGYSYHE